MNRPTSGPRRRCARTVADAVCAATGWQLGTATLTPTGDLVCPVCAVPVTARPVRAGVVEVTAHPPADAVTCTGCATVHARLACPGCGRPSAAADAVLAGLVFGDAEAAQ